MSQSIRVSDLVAERVVLLDRLEDDFVSNVNHDLRPPITHIIEDAEMLRSPALGLLNARQQEVLERIELDTHRLLRTLQDLVRSAVVGRGITSLSPSEVDLADLVTRSVRRIQPYVEEQQIGVTLDLHGGTSAVIGIPDDLSIMLDNLLANAVRFTPRGGRIHVSLSSDDGEYLLAVADSGCGIPAEELPLVFRRFYRSSAPRQHVAQGTGLGLSIALAVATTHGGHIEVSSSVGAGSVFTVRLPAAGLPTLAALAG